jgi:hypothetical protein
MVDSRQEYKEMSEVLGEAWAFWNPWMKEAKRDLEFYLGKQWTKKDEDYLTSQNRPHLVINKNIRRFVHLLTGYQRQNRLGITFKPWEGSDNITAEQFSKLALHAMEKGGGYHQISRTFAPSVKVGMDWLNLYVDFNDDWENGDIRFKRTPWTKILPDPLFQELNLSDCGYLFRRENITKRQLQLLMPNQVPKDFKPSNFDSYQMILDPTQNLITKQDRYTLTEFWQREWKSKTFLIDATTGEKREFETSGRGEEDRLRLLLSQFPQIKVVKKRKSVITLKLFIGEELAWHGEDPIGCGDYPYVPFICYFDPEHDELKLKLQGIIRSLRDPQEELNKRRSQILHIINTMATSGWMWEEGALVDETQMANASGAGTQIKTKKGQLMAVRQIERPNFPHELVKIEEMFARDGVDVSGINAELLSMTSKDTPGISIQLRQRQGLVIIQEIFDNLKTAKKEVGTRYLKAVQSNYSAQKVARIIGQAPSPQFYIKDFQKYDCVVDDAVNSPTQREFMFQKLLWFHQNVAPVHPMLMLELADIPERYRDLQAQFMMSQLGGGAGQPGMGEEAGQGVPPPGQQG